MIIKECPVCHQQVKLKKGDDIALCSLIEHTTYYEIREIQNKETLFYNEERLDDLDLDLLVV